MSSTWQTVDDMDPLLMYYPESNWRLDNFVPGPNVNDASTHTASGDDSTVTIHFKGTAVIVYTYIRPNAANFTAELDGSSTFVQADMNSVNTTQPSATWGGLEDTEHVLVLRKSMNDPDRRGNVPGVDLTYLSLDYLQIKGTLLAPVSSTPISVGSSGTSRSGGSTHSLPIGAIVGIVLGFMVALMFFAALAYHVSRRRRRFHEIGDLQPFIVRKRVSFKLPECQSTRRNARHTLGSAPAPALNSASAAATSHRPSRSRSLPSHARVHSKGSTPSPASSKTPFIPKPLVLPEQARTSTNRRSGRAGNVCRGVSSCNSLNIRDSRRFRSGNRRSSNGMLQLPGHYFIHINSPIDLPSPASSHTLPSPASSRTQPSPVLRSPAGGYASPSTPSSFSGISGPIISDFPLPPPLPNQYLQPWTPLRLPADPHKAKKVQFRSSVATYKSTSQVGSHNHPASPVQSTILRHFVNHHAGDESPSSPVESSIIIPPSIVPSSCAVPYDQFP